MANGDLAPQDIPKKTAFAGVTNIQQIFHGRIQDAQRIMEKVRASSTDIV